MLNKIRKEGYSRVIAITKVLPAEWQAVKLIVTKKTQSSITVRFEKVC